ncbi:hypothetical protein TRFO_23364 [Tritrichomonas foetus]|uniref:Uncharacterized protein n=1 Tax=Tritrichomonas foetus TaxID=1144522 RepID=A0A1J4K9R6_9EUKA|nr:hypothetical protein TRFO_23364 [Tritrichomonas foetus]|eukprot:OHT08209.1 hypothetical protein TRFO_23364 [Tritrichomonas foetus]
MNQVDSEKADGKEVEEKNDNRTKVEAEIENKDDENEDDEVNKEGDEENKEDEEEESESSSSEVTDDDDDDDEKKLFTKEAIASRKSDEEMMLASPEFCFHKLLTSEYPHIRNPPLMSPPNKCPCPASLFVIISMFLQTKFLEDNEISDAHFDSCLSVFIAEFPTIPLTTAKKLSLTMLLYMFCSDNRMFSKSKTEQFVNSLKPIFEKQFNRYLSRFVNRTEVLINRFATATFEFDHLLADFREIISGTANTFSKFGSDDMNRLLNDRFLYLFQIKLLNKIISNPSRFNFTNSMIWNSFLTAVENDERISLDVLRQAISGLIMASNISTSPDLSDDVCPSIPKPLIAFFLKNYQKDENITNELKTKDFLKVYKISKIPQTYEEMKPKPNTIEWKALKENILIGNWNKIDKDEPIASFYPFLSRYVA